MNLSNITVHWKSSLSGILTVSLTTTATLLALPQIQTLVSPKVLLWIGAFQAVGKVWVSLIQQDAGTTIAVVPGNPEPQAVASHEIPNVQPAKVVLPEVKE